MGKAVESTYDADSAGRRGRAWEGHLARWEEHVFFAGSVEVLRFSDPIYSSGARVPFALGRKASCYRLIVGEGCFIF